MSVFDLVYCILLGLVVPMDAVYVRYRRCAPRLVCTELALCPRQARMVHRKADVHAVLELLGQTLCAIHDSNIQVCCHDTFALVPLVTSAPSKDAVVPSPGAARHPNLRHLDHNGCGVGIKNRGVGGVDHDTVPGEVPWLALLQYELGDGRLEFRCAGALISDRHVVTAAHCVSPDDFSQQLASVRIGEHDLSTSRDCALNGAHDEEGVLVCARAKPLDMRIVKVTIHPVHDIALVRMRDQLRIEPHFVVPVCLPLSDSSLPHGRLDVVSWRLDAPSTPRRQSIETTPCGENKLCIAKPVCDVTPGTPATMTLGNLLTTRVAVLVGVVGRRASSSRCDAPVFTRVDTHLAWLLDNLESTDEKK